MTEREEMFNAFSDKEKEKILGKEPTKLFYKFNDFEYKTESKPRILSGIKKLDYMLKGFELGCITLWSGATNARQEYTTYAYYKRNNKTKTSI